MAAIECVHIHLRTLPLDDHRPHLAALDVAHRGSVANWFSSLVLAAAAALAVVTFGIRVHRVDDYRGRYRVWLWTAAALAWASLDAGTHIHDSLGLAIAHLAGKPLLLGTGAAACTISWLALYGLVFGTLAIRLAIEVWQSLPAFTALAVAGLCYLLAGLATLEMLPQQGPLVDSVVRTTILLVGHVGLFSAVALYARHVVLDAGGRLKVHIDPDKNRKSKAKTKARLKVVKEESQVKKSEKIDKTEKTEAKPVAASGDKASSTGGPLKFAMGGSAPAKAAATISKASAAASNDDEDEDEEDDADGDQKLSRAERRRLKKLARRDVQRRAA